MVVGQAMYTGAAAAGPGDPEHPGGNGHGKPRGEEVVEGENSEV